METSALTPAGGSEDYQQAISQFTEQYQSNPGDLSAVLGLSRNLRYSGDAKTALGILGEAQDQFANKTDYQSELGKVRLANGDIAGAQASLEKAISLAPNSTDNWHAYAALGVVYDLLRTFDRAQSAYDKAFSACSSSISLRNNMAISAGMSGDPKKALRLLRDLGREVPAEPTVARNIRLFEDMSEQCVDCTSQQYQDIASSIYAPGAGAITDEMVCDEPKSEMVAQAEPEPIAQAIVQKNFADVNIQFEFNSAILAPTSLPVLNDLADAISGPDLKNYRFILEGHTDARGSDAYNQALSEARAQAVKLYLVEDRGIQETRLDSIDYGEQRLLNTDNPEADINRRVRITRLGKITN